MKVKKPNIFCISFPTHVKKIHWPKDTWTQVEHKLLVSVWVCVWVFYVPRTQHTDVHVFSNTLCACDCRNRLFIALPEYMQWQTVFTRLWTFSIADTIFFKYCETCLWPDKICSQLGLLFVFEIREFNLFQFSIFFFTVCSGKPAMQRRDHTLRSPITGSFHYFWNLKPP